MMADKWGDMRFSVSKMGISSVIVLIIAVGAVSLGLFLQHENTRDQQQWHDKLDLIADAHTRDVSGWVQTQFRELNALSNNASLQIYFTQLQADNAGGQADYLRNLITLTAQRLGFEPNNQTLNRQLGANIRQLGTGGLALVDNNGKQLLATSSMPPITDELRSIISDAPRGESSLIDITQLEDGSLRLGFIVPIYALQSDKSAASQIGMLIGLRPVASEFFALLSPEATSEETLEVALVRAEGNKLRYLSPLIDKSPLMSRAEDNNVEKNAAAFAVVKPDQFAERTDYRGEAVWMTARAVPFTNWVLIAKIDRAEALAETIAWRNTVVVSIVLLLAALSAIVVALWRHASAREQASLAAESGARAELLSVVTDNQPEPLYIVDEKMHLWFANYQATNMMASTLQDLRAKPLANVIGPSFVQMIAPFCEQAIRSNKPQSSMVARAYQHETRQLYMQFIPLDQVPVEGLDEGTRGVLIIEQDMNDVIQEREMRVNTLNQLVEMLVSLVDKRDPNAAEHSARVAVLSAATARAMKLDATMIETTEIAARLMNLGKVEIPTELLTRSGKLNNEERDAIRNSLANSAELLKDIVFDGPVADTLRHAQEQVDGSGPLGLKADDILVSARIIAVANALVSMLSPRSYRPALAIEDAISQLQKDVDTRFDRKVISALMHYLDNLGGREVVQNAAEKPERISA